MRVRLDIAYDGADFSGWARQPGRRTVQETVERALATVLRLPHVALTVAGRTDAGVHAVGQVAHCDLPELPADLLRRLAGVLAPDVRVTAVQQAPEAFDARFAAVWRRYEYRICDAESGPKPLRRGQVLRRPGPLDVAAMAAAAHHLVGLHDFVAFCKRRDGATTTRTLLACTVERDADEIICTVVADAFCRSMVRSLVGALVTVGEGHRPASWPATLLTTSARATDVRVLPPHGLVLVEVGYPPDDELAARVAVARARRS